MNQIMKSYHQIIITILFHLLKMIILQTSYFIIILTIILTYQLQMEVLFRIKLKNLLFCCLERVINLRMKMKMKMKRCYVSMS